jgi:flagellar biosynthesis/type III secretory pathway protein FliH
MHPERIEIVEAWLPQRPPADGMSIVLEADGALGLNDCTLETANGVIETGLGIQLQALHTALFAAT